MVKLGRLELKNQYIYAPMSIFSDIGFRLVCENYGAAYSFTEQIYAADFIAKKDYLKKVLDLHSPCGIQFLSNSSEELIEAIRIIKDNEFYDGLENIKSIDLNLACPAKKTREKTLGSELLKHATLVEELFTTLKKHSHLPVSAKLRLAVNSAHKKSKPYLRIAKIADKCGLDFITIHGRMSSQTYEDPVDLEAIKEAADEISIPVIGNGDVDCIERAKYMLQFCKAVMIGRHAVKEPFIFGELLGKTYIREKEKIECMKKYLNYAKEYNIGFQHIKIHVQSLLKDTQYFKQMMDLTHTKNNDQLFDIIDNILMREDETIPFRRESY